ncbi:MAG: glycosyltransferase family 1 protein [Erythrobacter sp.]
MIYLNARFTGQSMTGVQRVGYELGRRLVARRPDVTAIAPVEPLPDYSMPVEVVPSAFPAAGGHFWEQVTVRRKLGDGDLLVGLGGTGPLAVERQIVMIHDVNYLLGPDGYSRKFRYWYTALEEHLARRATICTVSHWSATEISKAFGIALDSITVIPNAADHLDDVSADACAIGRYGLDRKPYVLCVGSANPNKNFATALAAYASLDDPSFDLVIVGGSNPKIFQDEEGMALHPRVHRLPRVTDSELKAIFEKAQAFVMPSLLEGFGIPAIEAMKVNTPVIAAKAAALPEVCGDAALYFEPLDASSLAKAMTEVVSNHDLTTSLRENGGRCVARYSWDRSVDILERLIDKKISPRR